MKNDKDISRENEADELPPELNMVNYEGSYVFPNNSRRRIPGALYIFLGIVFSATWAISLGGDTPLVNYGFLAGGVLLMLLGVHHLATAWNLSVDDEEAFKTALDSVDFQVGHAAAQMGWRGFASRPTWRVLLYSNEPQPEKRALVLIDGTHGTMLNCLVEKNPEDWSDIDASNEGETSENTSPESDV